MEVGIFTINLDIFMDGVRLGNSTYVQEEVKIMKQICYDCTCKSITRCHDCVHYRPKKDYFEPIVKDKELKQQAEKALEKKGQSIADTPEGKHLRYM